MSSIISRSCLAASVLAGLAAGTALPAAAAKQDHVYADSFGNLVIESAAGYKRILVGEGAMARKLADYVGAGRPRVEYLDPAGAGRGGGDCYRPPVLVKGRSYMYGFSEGEIPQISPCR